jgi:hypothetical protein
LAKRIAIAFGVVILLVVGLGQFLSRYLLQSEKTPEVQAVAEKRPGNDLSQVKEPIEIKRINVVSVKGKVDRRLNDSSWVAVQPGDKLQQEETIRTNRKGRAVLEVGETAVVEIEPRSHFSVREVARTVARVYLHVGRISAVVHGQKGSKFKVESKGSDAVAETGKGEFSVLTTGDGQVAVATQKGEVRFSSKDKSVEVKAGNQSVVQPDSPPTAPEPIPASLYLKVVKPTTTLQRGKNTTIEGAATPGAFISINGVRVTTDDTGQFSSMVALKEGANPILVEVEDASGNRKSETLPAITVKSRVSTVQSKAGRWGRTREPNAPH